MVLLSVFFHSLVICTLEKGNKKKSIAKEYTFGPIDRRGTLMISAVSHILRIPSLALSAEGHNGSLRLGS